jgi:hypothetical protein
MCRCKQETQLLEGTSPRTLTNSKTKEADGSSTETPANSKTATNPDSCNRKISKRNLPSKTSHRNSVGNTTLKATKESDNERMRP